MIVWCRLCDRVRASNQRRRLWAAAAVPACIPLRRLSDEGPLPVGDVPRSLPWPLPRVARSRGPRRRTGGFRDAQDALRRRRQAAGGRDPWKVVARLAHDPARRRRQGTRQARGLAVAQRPDDALERRGRGAGRPQRLPASRRPDRALERGGGLPRQAWRLPVAQRHQDALRRGSRAAVPDRRHGGARRHPRRPLVARPDHALPRGRQGDSRPQGGRGPHRRPDDADTGGRGDPRDGPPPRLERATPQDNHGVGGTRAGAREARRVTAGPQGAVAGRCRGAGGQVRHASARPDVALAGSRDAGTETSPRRQSRRAHGTLRRTRPGARKDGGAALPQRPQDTFRLCRRCDRQTRPGHLLARPRRDRARRGEKTGCARGASQPSPPGASQRPQETLRRNCRRPRGLEQVVRPFAAAHGTVGTGRGRDRLEPPFRRPAAGPEDAVGGGGETPRRPPWGSRSRWPRHAARRRRRGARRPSGHAVAQGTEDALRRRGRGTRSPAGNPLARRPDHALRLSRQGAGRARR